MRGLRRIVLLSPLIGLLLFSGAGVGMAQEVDAWVGGLEAVEDLGIASVNVDVFVRDKDGGPATGLTQDRFRAFLDGEERQISSFSVFTQERLIGGSPLRDPEIDEEQQADEAAAAVEDVNPIYIVLYIDNANLRHMDRNRVLRPLQRFAKSVLAGPAQIMIVGHGATADVLLPFTGDAREVAQVLSSLRLSETKLEEVDEDHEEVRREIRRAIKNRHKTTAGRQQVLADLYDDLTAFAFEEERRLLGNLNALHEIGSMLTGINGRKYIVYVSSGLPLVLAKDLFHEFAGLDDRMTTVSLTIPYNKRNYFNSLAAAANAQEITFHAVDVTGPFAMTSSIGDSDSPRSAQAATLAHENRLMPLRMLTEKTGGLAIINTEDFDEGFQRIKTDLMTYYAIGYDIEAGGSDKVHHINIEVTGEEGYDLRFRRAFIEKSLPSQIQEKVNASLFFDVDENPMDLFVATGAQQSATPDRWMQPLEISFPVEKLALAPDGEDYVGTALFFIATRDFDGRSTDIQRRSHEVRIPAKEYEQRRMERSSLALNLLLGEGRHHIAVGLLDETTRRASYFKVEKTIYSAATVK